MIFDTDILVWAQRGHSRAAEFIDRVPAEERNLSVISYLELLYGARNRSDLKNIQSMAADLFAEVVPISQSASAVAARLMESLVLAHRLDVSDAIIAATALDRHETLATGNSKHFKAVPGLSLLAFRP